MSFVECKWLLDSFFNGLELLRLIQGVNTYLSSHCLRRDTFSLPATISMISAARERSMLIKEQIGLLTDAVTKTELLMRHSPTNYLEVLTAQQALLAARQTEVQCRYDEIAGIITLYHALGGGR